MDNVLKIKKAVKNNELTEDDYDYIVGNNKYFISKKSEYFKMAKKDKTIKFIEISSNTKNGGDLIFQPIKVPSERFNEFILQKESVQEETEREVKIFIVCPVLVKGSKCKWKGYMGNESIEFGITDEVFLTQVYAHEIKFANGSFIECTLKTITTFMGNMEK
ncbi:MAG: hypothetical protein LBC07_00125 [Elusimicrobiota bacterium]|nr:hypothetical protein [Elusimicrobiota bacterium]